MSSASVVSWAMTAVFGICAGLYVAKTAAAVDWQSRVAWSLHLLMALAMIAMTWPWGMRIPAIGWVLVFTAAALCQVYFGLSTDAVGRPPSITGRCWPRWW